ncbi:hypothetical protein FRC02_007593 [Tulasnella sp. 418]|nr:hypothetical protein FRC02_007593 [Tulasnella sp. 418]
MLQSAVSADWLGDVEDLVDAMEQQWDNDTTSLLGDMITHLQEILQQQDNNGGGFIAERLATLMLLRFRWIGDIADLNQSIGLYQEVFSFFPTAIQVTLSVSED